MKIHTNKIECELYKNGNCYFLFDNIEWKMNQGECCIEFNNHTVYFKDMECNQECNQNSC